MTRHANRARRSPISTSRSSTSSSSQMTALRSACPGRSVRMSNARPKARAATMMRALSGVRFTFPPTSLLLAEAETFSHLRIRLRALLHEGVHLVEADVGQLEAALEREVLHLRIGVERCPQ